MNQPLRLTPHPKYRRTGQGHTGLWELSLSGQHPGRGMRASARTRAFALPGHLPAGPDAGRQAGCRDGAEHRGRGTRALERGRPEVRHVDGPGAGPGVHGRRGAGRRAGDATGLPARLSAGAGTEVRRPFSAALTSHSVRGRASVGALAVCSRCGPSYDVGDAEVLCLVRLARREGRLAGPVPRLSAPAPASRMRPGASCRAAWRPGGNSLAVQRLGQQSVTAFGSEARRSAPVIRAAGARNLGSSDDY